MEVTSNPLAMTTETRFKLSELLAEYEIAHAQAREAMRKLQQLLDMGQRIADEMDALLGEAE